jgi:hypothetical protein
VDCEINKARRPLRATVGRGVIYTALVVLIVSGLT